MKENYRIISELHEKLKAVAAPGQLTSNPENIHIFRVTYKKLRAFLRLLRSVQPGTKRLRSPDSLRSIYRQLGRIRDWQLLRSRLSQHSSAGSLKAVVDAIDAYVFNQQNLVEETQVMKVIASCDKILQQHAHKVPDPISVELFLHQKWSVLHSISNGDHFADEDVHRFRKNLKDIYYIINLTAPFGIVLHGDGYPGNNKETFVSLMKELGEYNDLCIAINHLSTIAWREPQVIGSILSEWMAQKEPWLAALHAKVLHLGLEVLPADSQKDPRPV